MKSNAPRPAAAESSQCHLRATPLLTGAHVFTLLNYRLLERWPVIAEAEALLSGDAQPSRHLL